MIERRCARLAQGRSAGHPNEVAIPSLIPGAAGSAMRLIGPTESAEQRALRSSIIASRMGVLGSHIALTDESGRLLGPFACMPYSPVVGDALQHLGTALRSGSELSMECREAAVLKVAFEWRADYLWYVHAPVAEREGCLDTLDIERIGAGLPPLARSAAMSVRICGTLLQDYTVPPELYADAAADLGERALVELIVTIGYYSQLAMLVRAFETPTPDAMVLPWT
jgi:4-carboxymuconolactone decarboxylase